MTRLFLVGAGGFLGAVARYGLTGLVHRLPGLSWPLGTLVVNVIGCLLIGAAMSAFEDSELFSPNARLFLTVGVLGAFTTFSTFGHETLALARDGGTLPALANALLHLVLGFGAVWVGWAAVRALGS
jgi:CrcB protein